MPKHPRQQFSDGLSVLQKNYLRRVAGYIGDVRRLRELVAKDFLPVRDLQQMFQVTHNLMGSGATFGFPDISTTAKALNIALKALLDEGEDTGDAAFRQRHVVETLAPFEDACTDAVSTQTTARKPRQKPAPLRLVRSEAEERTVYLVCSEPETLPGFAEALTALKLDLQTVSRAGDLDLQGAGSPRALVIAMDDPCADLPRLSPGPDKDRFLAVVSSRGDFAARLAAVRAGAQAYLPPDADPAALAARIAQHAVFQARPKTASHILIVDADETSAAFYAHILRQAGCEISIASDPALAAEAIASKPVDAVFTAFQLGACTGAEFAAVVRQWRNADDFPIVFAVSRDEFEALPVGFRDDKSNHFLIKTFSPNQLLSLAARIFA
jgi:DNA-binding response OmpR family regulator